MKTVPNISGAHITGRVGWCVTCRFDKHCTLKDPSVSQSAEVAPLITNPDGSCQLYKVSPWSFRKNFSCRIH